jgi:hypothetical protein
MPVAVEDALVDDGPGARARVVDAVPDGLCALEPHPAASTTTAIAVTPAARMR